MNDPRVVAVGVDVGGTNVRAAAVTADGTIVRRARAATPFGDADAMVGAILAVAAQAGDPALPLGIGVAGLVTVEGHLALGTNLGIDDVDLGARVTTRLGRPARFANDANMALYAEYRAGAGRGAESIVMLTLGTGVGGAVLVGGRVLDGVHGFGGELGHIIVRERGRRCPCGNEGCLEAYASGTAIGTRARSRLVDPDRPSSLRALDRDSFTGVDVTAAAVEGDELACEILTEVGHWLGVGAASLVNALDPDLILLGGGAASPTAPWVLPAARSAMAARIIGAARRPVPEVRLAALADDAGVIGAALRAADDPA